MMIDILCLSAEDQAHMEKIWDILSGPTLNQQLASLNNLSPSSIFNGDTEQASTRLRPAVQAALEKAFQQLHLSPKPRPNINPHAMFTAISGAVRGHFGFAGSLMELPIATSIMMQAIAQIALAIRGPEASLRTPYDCLCIFAISGSPLPHKSQQATPYYEMRDHLRRLPFSFLEPIKSQENELKILLEFVTKRFSFILAERINLQSARALQEKDKNHINTTFINHYMNMAKAHFTILKLEQRYNYDSIRHHYLQYAKNEYGHSLQ